MASSAQKLVILPTKCSQLFEELVLHDGKFLDSFERNTLDKLDTTKRTLAQYNLPALRIGRPLNKCLFVAFGESGVGKSTTINSLFADTLCPTNAFNSETRVVTEYSRHLSITTTTPNAIISGRITFVDVPGTLATNSSDEATNFHRIKSYRENDPCLAPRPAETVPDALRNMVRSKVYPNLVLLVVSATDTRILGADSNFHKTLRALALLDLVDYEFLNLLVIVTNALYFPKKHYAAKAREFERVVQEVVYTTIRVKGVKVVFIDNKAEEYLDEKPRGSDFWQLPDGQYSHLNVMNAITDSFRQKGDILGLLMAGWYFHSECKDKQKKVIVDEPKYIRQSGTANSQELDTITAKLTRLGLITPETPTANSVPTYYFSSLGHGYCPVTESVKHYSLLGGLDSKLTKEVSIQGHKYLVPHHVTATLNKNGSKLHRLCFENQDLYQVHKSRQYGLEGGFELVVNAASSGRWVNDRYQQNHEALLSIIYENQIASMRVDDPKRHLTPFFKEALKKLPKIYDGNTAYEFNDFFSRFGTHLIVEQGLGGEIIYDCKVNGTNFNEMTGIGIRNMIGGIFDRIAAGNMSLQNGSRGVESLGVIDENFYIRGGNPPNKLLRRIDELTPDLFADWLKTVPTELVELEQGFKLFPYYNITQAGAQAEALRMATKEYLKNRLPQRQILRRNVFAKKVVKDAQEDGLSWLWAALGGAVLLLFGIVGAVVARK